MKRELVVSPGMVRFNCKDALAPRLRCRSACAFSPCFFRDDPTVSKFTTHPFRFRLYKSFGGTAFGIPCFPRAVPRDHALVVLIARNRPDSAEGPRRTQRVVRLRGRHT